MNKDFWKQPSVIASALIVVSFFLFPFYRPHVVLFGMSGGTSFTDLNMASGDLDILLWLLPVASVYLIYAAYKETDQWVSIAKWVLLVVAAFFWLRYAFLMEGTQLKFVGFGMWLALLAAIFVRFEVQIMSKINAGKGE